MLTVLVRKCDFELLKYLGLFLAPVHLNVMNGMNISSYITGFMLLHLFQI